MSLGFVNFKSDNIKFVYTAFVVGSLYTYICYLVDPKKPTYIRHQNNQVVKCKVSSRPGVFYISQDLSINPYKNNVFIAHKCLLTVF